MDASGLLLLRRRGNVLPTQCQQPSRSRSVAPAIGVNPAFSARNLQELRKQLLQSRVERQEQVSNWVARTPAEKFKISETERFLDLRLQTATSKNFAGQFVEEKGRLVYASLFAKPEKLAIGG